MKRTKGETTRKAILDAALVLFRKRGFDDTTVRDIAKEAGVALGAAYYYFPSKEALILSYYAEKQDEHARRARARLVEARGVRDRLAVVLHTKLDVLGRDRKLLSALLRTAAVPESPVSLFAPETRPMREKSAALFDEALADTPLPPQVRSLLALLLWSLEIGILLYFVHDRSPRQAATRRLVDGVLERAMDLAPIAPLVAPRVPAIVALLQDAGLSPQVPPR